MKCFVLSRDLMFSSQASSAATQANVEPQTVSSSSDVSAEAEGVTIVDLSTPGLDVDSVISGLAAGNTKVIAVGPHVHGEKLEAAQAAGAHYVLTKGQAHRELTTVLQRIADG